MSQFYTFLQFGFEHILDFQGFDHILFVVVLCAIYLPAEWRRILILVTAFTIGHSLTIALAAFNIFRLPSNLVEFLIPLTILATAFSNFLVRQPTNIYSEDKSRIQVARYFLAGGFGLIHGLGFSGHFIELTRGSEHFTSNLLAFTLGIELGQICIVLAVMLLAFVFIKLLHTPRREWNLAISGMVAGMAFMLLLENNIL
jgi:hypothetical protein